MKTIFYISSIVLISGVMLFAFITEVKAQNLVDSAIICTDVSACGNGAIDSCEQYDGNNLGSKTCQDFEFTGGTLSCNSNCTFNTSGCTGGGGNGGGGWIQIENPLSAGSFEEIVDNIIDFIFKIAIVLAPLMILIGAFYIMTAGGDTNRVTTGKSIILYTLIGFAIILIAKGLVAVIIQLLGG